MRRANCWEVLKCGRQPGGERVAALGVCPAAVSGDYDGVNGGRFGGRVCWSIAGTACRGEEYEGFAEKLMRCMRCKFLQQVQAEEGRAFILSPRFRKPG